MEPVRYSDWETLIVPVLKADGKVRVCGDYKLTVNRVSHLEQYPIPTLDDLCEKLTGGKQFSKLDLSHAYSQLPLDNKSKEYATVNNHRGLFRYNRLPYGISSAPAIFQRTMTNILQDIPGVAVYLDDIVLTGATKAKHLETLDLVLGRLKEAGLRLKREKRAFLADEVVYLGHKIDQHGLHSIEDKVEAIQNAKAPENVLQLQAFLGLLNYFLANLSTVLAPLHKLLCKGQKWFWGSQQQRSFQRAKELLLSAKVLAHFDPSKRILLQCDASNYGLGVVLSHVMEDGTERPVRFVSRTLNAAEKNYSQLDKEGAAVMFALIEIITDLKPLVSLFGELKQVPTTASPRIQRWAVTLSGYEYNIHYKAGKSHNNADCPGRLPLPVIVKSEPEEHVLLIEELDCSPVSAEQISRYTGRDPTLAYVREYLMRGWPAGEDDAEFAPYKCQRDELSVQDGCVLWVQEWLFPHSVVKK